MKEIEWKKENLSNRYLQSNWMPMKSLEPTDLVLFTKVTKKELQIKKNKSTTPRRKLRKSK